MNKESGFDPLSPVKEVGKAVKKEVSEQAGAAVFRATARLLRTTGKETTSNLAGTLDKLAKRTARE